MYTLERAIADRAFLKYPLGGSDCRQSLKKAKRKGNAFSGMLGGAAFKGSGEGIQGRQDQLFRRARGETQRSAAGWGAGGELTVGASERYPPPAANRWVGRSSLEFLLAYGG